MAIPAISPDDNELDDDSGSKTGKFVVFISLATPVSLKLQAKTLCASTQSVFDAENPTYISAET